MTVSEGTILRRAGSGSRAAGWIEHVPYLILLTGGTIFLIILALLHHRALGTGYDLGIYDQVMWNLAHGRPFHTTLVYETGGYYDHFEPVLALLAPIYWLFPDVRVLLILQSLALGLGSLPVYLYARQQLAGIRPSYAGAATLIAAAYLAFPALHNANINDFHEVALLPPLLGFALYGLLRGRRRILLIFLALCLLVKEDFGVTALAISLYILVLKPKGFRRRDGFWMAVAVLSWVLLVLYVFYPALTHGMPYPFVARRYPWLGDSPQSALTVLLTQPWVIVPHLLQPPKLQFLLRLFGPLLFLPLLGWPVIGLALPILAYLMLSSYEPQWSVQSYYNPPLAPFVFFALVNVWSRTVRWAATRWERGRATLVAFSCLLVFGIGYGYYADAPGPGGRAFEPGNFAVSERAEAAYQIMGMVPAEASLSTEWPLISHLSHRRQIYTLLARPTNPPDYLLMEERPGTEGAPLYPFAAPPGPPVYHEYVPVAEIEPYRLLAHQRSLSLVEMPELDPPPSPLRLAAYAWLDTPAQNQAPVIRPGAQARLILGWRRTGSLTRRYVFFVHLLESGGPEHKSSRIVTQSGHEAGDGKFPTTFWESWTNPRVILDEQRLEISPDTAPGVYYAWAGVYDKETGQRLEVGGPGQDLVLIGALTVRQ